MDLRDFSEIGQQIERTVKNAVDSMNFDKLNQNINETLITPSKTNTTVLFIISQKILMKIKAFIKIQQRI